MKSSPHKISLAFVLLALPALLLAQSLTIQPVAGSGGDFIRGADISMLGQIEELGGKYFDENGKASELMALLKANGVNWVRLRLWNKPINELPVLLGDKILSNKGQRVGGGNNDLERTVMLAKRAKALGLKVLLDFHYSDFWADPGKQTLPQEWKNLDAPGLEKALYQYTKMVMARLVKENARPDMVQIGNELNNGMLWPLGKIWASAGEKVGGFEWFTKFLAAGARAVRESDPVKSGDKRIKIAIHLADGGRNALYRSIFDPLSAAGLDFDIIGLSYYPYWHGSLEELNNNLADLALRYRKDLVIMETAYAFTEDDHDGFGNAFQIYNGKEGGYLPTVQGQATVVRDVAATIAGAPEGRGKGFFYWEPAWLALPGAGWRTGEGNAWENQAMFDFSGKALPSLKVFQAITAPVAGNTAIAPVRVLTEPLILGPGEALVLPDRVKTVMSDDSWRWQEVQWEKKNLPAMEAPGTYQLAGKLAGGLGATLNVERISRKNLLTDPSFESGSLGSWEVVDAKKASLVEKNQGNAKTGDWTWKYWADKPFDLELSREMTGLSAGTYSFKLSAMGGGGEKSMEIFIRRNDGSETRVPLVNKGWKAWVDYTVSAQDISGSCRIGIRVQANAGNWGNFDDLEFYRN